MTLVAVVFERVAGMAVVWRWRGNVHVRICCYNTSRE